MKLTKETILALFFVIFLSSCIDGAPSKENEKDVDIRGKVVKVNPGNKEAMKSGRLGTFMVEGFQPGGTEYKASVTVTEKTLIFKQSNQIRTKAGFEDLREGRQVEVKFKGPVLMSYPVQAEAGEVRIVEQAKREKGREK
jgi:hypothetical protein